MFLRAPQGLGQGITALVCHSPLSIRVPRLNTNSRLESPPSLVKFTFTHLFYTDGHPTPYDCFARIVDALCIQEHTFHLGTATSL